MYFNCKRLYNNKSNLNIDSQVLPKPASGIDE